MKATELKKGNIVYNGYEGGNEKLSAYQIAQIELMNNGGNVAEYYRTLEYTPLTEDWLLKFGFEQIVDISEFGKYAEFELSLNGFNIEFHIQNDIVDCYLGSIGIDILYVHQLQNLYFALTSQELTIKE